MKKPDTTSRAARLLRLWVAVVALTLSCGDSSDDHAPVPDEDHAGHDEHLGEEGLIELTSGQLESAGIRVETVGPGAVFESRMLPGTILPNEDAVTHVTPRVPGQVRRVAVQLGDSVEPGDLLCVIDSVELGDAVAAFLRAEELVSAAEETLRRGRELYRRRLESLTAVMDGAVEVARRIHAREEELQARAVSTIRPLLEAEKALELAELDREKQFTELRAERDARLLELDLDVRARRIDVTAARNRLRTLGVAPGELAGLQPDSALLAGEVLVRSRGAGVIVDRHISAGEYVDAGSKLFIVQDLSQVWFVASAFEEQLHDIGVGQAARVTLDAFPDAPLDGKVSFLDYRIDATSRALGVRITLENAQVASWDAELPLRPGMFGRAEVRTEPRTAALVLPESALVHEDSGDAVFVRVGEFEFERRPVRSTPVAGGFVEIVQGLTAGEDVVVEGAFLLKSVERSGELGGGHSH